MNDQIKIGSTVTWMHASSNGRSIGFTTRAGKVTYVDQKIVMVKARNGKCTTLPLERVRLFGQRTELTEFVMGI